MSVKYLKELEIVSDKKLFLLFSLYLSSILIFAISDSFNTELLSSDNFMIGEATAKGVNVSARISNFYSLLFIGLSSLVTFYFLLQKLAKSFISSIQFKNELSTLLGLHILLAVVYFFNDKSSESEAILQLSIFFLVGLELLRFFIKKDFFFLNETTLKSIFLSVIALFLVTENIFITGTVLLVFLALLKIKTIQKKFNSIIVLLSAVPLLLFFTVEITLILNQNGFYNLQYWIIACVVLLTFLSTIYLGKINQKELKSVLFNWQAPIVILGSCIYFNYSPTLPFTGDLFETANNLNPLMMSEVYHSSYYIDYISSHLMSDYFWMKLYAFFNGYQNDSAPFIYYNFSFCVYTLIIYYFLKEYFKFHFGIVLFMLLMPFLFFYFPYSYSFALIPLIFLNRYFVSKETRYLWWLGITSTLTVFWRLDLGIATVGTSIIIFIFLFLLEKKSRLTLIKIGAILTIFYGLLFLLYYSYCSELINQALHYFGGSQAHGISLLAEENSNLFYLDYYILPCLISLSVLYLLINFNHYKKENFFWVILFFAGFYFLNFQRGLVRHSFMSMNESYIASFAWIILILMFLRWYKWRLSMGLFSVLLLGGFLLSIHSVENKNSLLNENKTFSVNDLPEIDGKKIIRSTENKDYDKYTKPAVDFLKQQLKPNETFFDFSNSPLLYYHTEKKIPAYFSQSLQYIVDLYLQKECIKQIKNTKIPWIVYSRTYEAFGDNIDGVPNNIRYYSIASYLIDNYIPAGNKGLFYLWKRKNNKEIDSINHGVRPENWKLGLMPYFWKSNINEPKLTFIRNVKVENGKASIGKIVSGDFIQLTIKAEKVGELKMWMKGKEYNDFEVQMDIKEGTNTYKFPICGSYYLRSVNEPEIEFEINPKSKILKIEILNQ